jgi:GT2 family glycosyltransferase
VRIGYVCTNYNNSKLTREAVVSLLKNAGHEVRIVVVDNASSESDQTDLGKLLHGIDQVDIVFSKTNLGYFAGLNAGLAKLKERHSGLDWVIVGNNDLVFPRDLLDKLALRQPDLSAHAVVSPDIVTVEGEHQNPHVISGISRTREIFYDIYYSNYYLGCMVKWAAKTAGSIADRPDEEQWQIARNIYQGHGACYLLTPRFFEQFDELWAPTFMMSEEFFLSKQLSDVGQSVYYEPALQVVHHWHGSMDKLPSRQRWNMAKAAHIEYRKYVKIIG